MHHAAVPGEEPERHELAPRAIGRPWSEGLVARIAEAVRAEVLGRNLAVTVKFDDRVLSFSASERGETQP